MAGKHDTNLRLMATNCQQAWSLDRAGNWNAFNVGTGTNGSLLQSRSNNLVNEIINITNTTGAAWVIPLYDACGNMTNGPQPGTETNALKFVYDAWNRLTQVKTNNTVIATHRYDAANRRIAQLLATNAASPDVRDDYYYNSSWQTLEVRRNGLSTNNVSEQYVWSQRYLDAPVLRDRDADGVSTNGLEERLYYTGDAHFNVTALVSTNGTVLERYE